MEITTIPVGDAPPFSERSNGIYLMRSIEGKFIVKIFPLDGTVYWTQYSTLDDDSNDLVDCKESVLKEEEQEENNVDAIEDLAGDNNVNAEDIGEADDTENNGIKY